MSRVKQLSALIVFMLCSCGGGGGGGGSSPVGSPPTPTPTPAQTSTPVPQGNAIFTLSSGVGSSITAGKRRPRYVSTATKSIAITVNGSGSPTILNLNDPQHCDASGNCSIAVPAPVGADTFVVSAYDALDGAGSLLSQATVQATIAASGTTVSAVLDGYVATTSVSLGSSPPKLHQAVTIPVTVTAFDATAERSSARAAISIRSR